MGAVSEIVRPLSKLSEGRLVTIVMRDGSRVPASTTRVYTHDAVGVVAYDTNTRVAIPREQIKGWIA